MKTNEKAQTQYNLFRDSGDLKELFPKLTGNWEKDEKRFTRLWEDNNKILEEVEDSLNEDIL